MSFPSRIPALLAAGLAVAAPTGGCAMPPPCFSNAPGIVLPRADRVRPNLTHGESGRRLYDAVMDGDRAAAERMLRADPRLAGLAVDYDRRGDRPDGQTGDLLTFAVTNCDPEMLGALLAAGVSADGAERGLPLSFALLADQPVMAEMLFRAGASADPQKTGGVDVFNTIAPGGRLGAAMMLVRHGLDLKWVDRFGRGHLEKALLAERFGIAEELAAAGAPMWRVSMGGFMPVHSLFEPRLLADAREDAPQRRLMEKARRPGLPWPPPPRNEVAAKVVAGEWPTPAMREAGMVVTPEAEAVLRDQARRRGSLTN